MVITFIKNIRSKLKKFVKSDRVTPETSETALEQGKNKESRELANEPTGTPREKDKSQRKPRPKRRRSKKQLRVDDTWDISQFQVPPAEGKTRFHDLDLPDEIMHAVFDLGFQYCTPIQAEIMPSTLAGRDAAGQAQTGTGKTAAFLISNITNSIRNPIVGKRRSGSPRFLIIVPTRELVLQVTEEAVALSKYHKIGIVSIFGGMDYQKQKRQITERPVDMIVATPGRLIDFYEHGDMRLDKVECLVIDEADRMLDMGFIPQVRRIIRGTPPKQKRQTLLFSATLTPEVTRLSSQWTTDPVIVAIEPEQVEVDTVDQIIYLVTTREKTALVYNIITRQNLNRVLVFCNRKDETRRLADVMSQYRINCAVLSGDVPQKKRISTLENFRAGNIRVLIATDVAGRGLHVEGISHVINYTLPDNPENYVHRIGRTGRAGATGTSVSFACEEDSFQIPAIEEFIGHELHCTQPDKDWLTLPPGVKKYKPKKRRPRQRKQSYPG
ncbi:MAG: ATP-dependent RNA helicase RhlB [Deltaproteobacteria bacterium]|nr:ATP-dependent RNA helicase RhlB [Deltaproteobacteria bacterium]